MQVSAAIQSIIQQKLSEHFSAVRPVQFSGIGGESINETYRISFGAENVFCKLNSVSEFPQLFQKEKAGLELLAKQGILKTPAIIECFEQANSQVLVLEWIQPGEKTEGFWKKFGEQLATLHRISTDSFGLHEDNYMGSIPQSNRQHKTWVDFFAEERLKPMIGRCFHKKLLSKTHRQQFESVEKKLTEIFAEEKPSLLHGDLWNGNFMCNQNNEPVLIDPSVYFGHRSVDLAMTTLFGGFRQPFYEAYHHHFPLPKNHEQQWAVCNLYPLLIHLYLFGGGYLPQIENILRGFA
ncbi:fructosamine kinase family protein [Flavisolibacter ginsenosidimutans]|uniref:Fructosamine kinase family protein n=1 Tax=Flavisolibacter ginsenosidimutans TaxID=661481 RepID=A0A5B8UI64_9BACT|nr:fructosamine kinase family protein [Flavisolibacter ginsenosidimutans]QEC56056.1 fructosamine kinase family protein [Flavisolibacter ginsenosidimutans]